MRLKVLHVLSVDKENYYLNNLSDHSSPEVVEYSFVTFAGECEFGQSLEKRGHKVYYLDGLRRIKYPGVLRKLSAIIKGEDPHIVHTHLFDPSVMGLTAAKWQGKKTVLTRHHSDAIHEIASAAKRKFYLEMENYISRKSDHIIAPSQMVRDYLVVKEGVPDEKVTIIPYGQKTERFDAVTLEKIAAVRAELGMGRGLALVNVSRLFHRKGHVYLFEALSSLISDGLDATLYLVGDGDYRATLESICARLGITERVRFLGWRDDSLAVVAASDIVVHPSLEDALSSAVIEAVMLEKPIVATDISGVRDTLDDGKFGLVVPPADAESIRTAINATVADLETATLKAKMGRQYLLKYMDAERVSKAYEEIYTRVVG